MTTAYPSNMQLDQAAEYLTGLRRAVVVTHAKPDGDAFGSVVALASALRRMGVETHAYFMPPVPAQFDHMAGRGLAATFHENTALPLRGEEGEAVVIVDTGAWSQLAPMRAAIQPHLARTLILDHHLSGDVAAAHAHVEPRAAACCEIIADLIERLQRVARRNDLFDAAVCDALFVGIASDTGWFRFSNTRPHTHDWAAKLIRMGVDHAALYRKTEQNDRPEKLLLLVRALSSVRMLAGGKAAIMALRAQDFTETGALVEETERFVDLPQAVERVEVVALVTEPPANTGHARASAAAGSAGQGGAAGTAPAAPAPARKVSVSLRSKPGPGAVNVAQLAAAFGGGGHARAAGAKFTASLDEVVARITAAIEKALS